MQQTFFSTDGSLENMSEKLQKIFLFTYVYKHKYMPPKVQQDIPSTLNISIPDVLSR